MPDNYDRLENDRLQKRLRTIIDLALDYQKSWMDRTNETAKLYHSNQKTISVKEHCEKMREQSIFMYNLIEKISSVAIGLDEDINDSGT